MPKVNLVYKHAKNILETEVRPRTYILDILYKIKDILCFSVMFVGATSPIVLYMYNVF